MCFEMKRVQVTLSPPSVIPFLENETFLKGISCVSNIFPTQKRVQSQNYYFAKEQIYKYCNIYLKCNVISGVRF